MTTRPPTDWSRAEGIVDRALDLPAAERDAFVSGACGDDPMMIEAVRRWLKACDDPSLFPAETAVDFAAPLLAAPEPAGDGPGSRIGVYRVVRELGRGGMGTVYLAERADGHFERRVALKVMRRGLGDAQLTRRFVEERQILARLDHPGIAGLLDGGVTDDGRPFLVMPYVEGEHIDRYCDARTLSVEERLGILLDVCDAVHHAHRMGIVHRDLKPGNLLVAADGRARLLDFGIAKLLEPDPDDDASHLTRTGERLLTPHYASPEQIRGEGVTPASDVYALGVILHEILTGRSPYGAGPRTPHEIERAVLEAEPTLPSSAVTRTLPASTSGDGGVRASVEAIGRHRRTTLEGLRRRLRGDLDAIVLKALEKDPAVRYPTAGALAEDVRRHLGGLAIEARGPRLLARVRAPLRRHRTAVAAAVGLLAGTLALAPWLARAGDERAAASAEPGNGPVLAVGLIADYRDGHSGEPVAALEDMLATNLARTRGLAVLGPARLGAAGADEPDDASARDAYAAAARAAGATELLDGALYSLPGGLVRMDLRRTALSGGGILGAESAVGPDLFAVADSATLRLVAALGLVAPLGSVADVSTRSLAAYEFYSRGLRHLYAQERDAAEEMFEAALREDSSFAMAAYYSARNRGWFWRSPSATEADRAFFTDRISRAMRLAERASDRERLMIQAWSAAYHISPAMGAIADTLVVRYPLEVEGHLAAGASRGFVGDYEGAIPYFLRVLAMDSASLRVERDVCIACAAIDMLVEAYALGGSLDTAEIWSRRWLELQPGSMAATSRRADVLDAAGRYDETTALLADLDDADAAETVRAKHLLRAGALTRAEAALAHREDSEAALLRAIVLRNRGRFGEALAVARDMRATAGVRTIGSAAPPSALLEAQVLFELGRVDAAVALFDSIARWPAPDQPPSVGAIMRVLAAALSGAARWTAGDTTGLATLADSLERDGDRAYMSRPRQQHLYLRGLLAEARGDDEAAVDALGRALETNGADFSPVNLARARILVRLGRPHEAIETLRPATRGWFLETTNLHATLTEVHEALAVAWDAAGVPDSAAVHWRRVASAWAQADPELRERWSRAARRAGEAAVDAVGTRR